MHGMLGARAEVPISSFSSTSSLAIHVNATDESDRQVRSVLCRHYSPPDSDDKSQFGLSWHIVVSHFASSAAQADLTPVHLPVLLVVLLSPLVDQFPGHFAGLRGTQRKHVGSAQELPTPKKLHGLDQLF